MKQFDSQFRNVREKLRHGSENEQIRILLERQRQQFLADCQAERFENTRSRPITTEEAFKS